MSTVSAHADAAALTASTCHHLHDICAPTPYFNPRSHCEGDSRATNALRQLLVCLASGSVPSSWRAEYSAPSEISVGVWVADLVARCGALMRYKPVIRGAKGEGEGLQYWMGGMFTPYCFITATRQYSAQVCSVLFCNAPHTSPFGVGPDPVCFDR